MILPIARFAWMEQFGCSFQFTAVDLSLYDVPLRMKWPLLEKIPSLLRGSLLTASFLDMLANCKCFVSICSCSSDRVLSKKVHTFSIWQRRFYIQTQNDQKP